MVQRRYAEALENADEAMRILDAPNSPDRNSAPADEMTWYLAMALTDRAMANAALGRASVAPDMHRAMGVLSRIPANSDYRRDADCQRGFTSSRYAEILEARGDAGEARSRFAEAATTFRGLCRAHAEMPYYREELAVALTGLARLDRAGGRPTHATTELDEAMTVLDNLTGAEHDNAQYLSLRGRALLVGYRLSSECGRPEEARKRLEEGRSCLRQALLVDPDRQIDRAEVMKFDGERPAIAPTIASPPEAGPPTPSGPP